MFASLFYAGLITFRRQLTQRDIATREDAYTDFKNRVAKEWWLFHGLYKKSGFSDEEIFARFYFIQEELFRRVHPSLLIFVDLHGQAGLLIKALDEGAEEPARMDFQAVAANIRNSPRTILEVKYGGAMPPKP